MSNVLVDVCAALVTLLNAAAPGTFTPAFTAERAFVPPMRAEDIGDGPKVVVIPRSITPEQESRAHVAHVCEVQVGVFVKVNPQVQAETDAALNLWQQVLDYLHDPSRLQLSIPLAPSGEIKATRTKAGEVLPYDVERLRTQNIVMAVVTMTYRVRR